MEYVRKCTGVFTGKTIKPEAGEELTKFTKGDKVIVFNLEDYVDFQRDLKAILDGTLRHYTLTGSE